MSIAVLKKLVVVMNRYSYGCLSMRCVQPGLYRDGENNHTPDSGAPAAHSDYL